MSTPTLNPPEISGRAVRTYKVSTVRQVDAGLVKLGKWLETQICQAPEFAGDYFLRYRQDLDALLDARLRLMDAAPSGKHARQTAPR